MKKKVTHLTVIVCTLVLSIFIGCQTEKSPLVSSTKIDGKYKQYTDLGKLVSSTVIKEYKNGEFIETLEDGKQKITQYKGKYTVVNDSIYVEGIDYDLYKKFQDEIILFKYEFKGDTMIQSGIVRYKEKPIEEQYRHLNPNNFYVRPTAIKVYWLKLKE